MGVMWFVLGAVALIAVIVAAVSVLRRPSAEDLNSVRHYHSALGTLEHLAERNVRPVPENGVPGDRPEGEELADVPGQPRFYRRPDAVGPLPNEVGRPGEFVPDPLSPRSSRPVPPTTIRSSLPDPGAPLVFDDARPRDRVETDRAGLSPRSRLDRAQRHALDSMNRRPRRGITVAAVVVVAVILFTVLAIVGSQRSHKPTATPATGVPTTAHRTVATSPTRGSGHHRTTPTTAPSQLVAESSTSSTALYTVGPNSFRLNLSTSGPCWVNATSAATGSTIWTGTMQAGGSQDIPATGTTRVELGTLAVTVTVDGVPVVIPTSIHSPFILTFAPSTSPSTSAPAAGSAASTTTTALG